ncbi:hypothetical protein ABT391_02830 [Streptomyces jumonjinensis]|uniref:hypothetical protein n=1 Tax=Streptomyces jumonjinensis TaxID=1945 RepID=UPI003332310A
MAGDRRTVRRWAMGAGIALTVAVTGCSNGGNASGIASGVASKAASAVSSAGTRIGGAASSAAAQAPAAVASASAAAQAKLAAVKGGVNAKGEVRLGSLKEESDGRRTVEVTAANKADAAKSFAVQVNFRDGGGNLLDTVVVTVADVAAGKSGTATARSNRTLSGEVKTEVGRALRY